MRGQEGQQGSPPTPKTLCQASSCCSKIYQRRAPPYQISHIPQCSSAMQRLILLASLAGLSHASERNVRRETSHVRVGLLVIKLVVMPLPQVFRTAFAAKALPLKGWKSTGATHCPTWSLQYFTLVFLAGAIHRDRTGFPTLQITVFHHESQGDYNWRKKNHLQRVPHVTRKGIIKEKEEEEDDQGQGKDDNK